MAGFAVRGAAPGGGVPAGEERGRLVGEAAQGEGQAALAQVAWSHVNTGHHIVMSF